MTIDKGFLKDLYLPASLRERLSVPMGHILNSEEAQEKLRTLREAKIPFATCGDVVTGNAVYWGFYPFLAVVDGMTRRGEETFGTTILRPDGRPLIFEDGRRVRNPAAQLTAMLQLTVHEMTHDKGGIIRVDGEEDLAALSLIMEMPLGSFILYGQPGRGVVFVEAEPRTREHVAVLLAEMERYTSIVHPIRSGVLGGTFDHLHAGHRHLLTVAVTTCGMVDIGITTDAYLASVGKKGGDIQPFTVRMHAVDRFLLSLERGMNWALHPLDEPYGVTLEGTTEALVVSQETAASAERIQEMRQRQGLDPLTLVIATLVTDEHGDRISSTRIRRGELTTEGKLRSSAPAYIRGAFAASAAEPE